LGEPPLPPTPLLPAKAGIHGSAGRDADELNAMAFYTYLLASKRGGTLYCGHTDDLGKRIWEHKEKVYRGFTAKHDVARLVWYETHDTREAAFIRERQIKEWHRKWKVRLIEERNRRWLDLYETLNQ